MEAMQEQYFDLVWEAGDAMRDCNWTEFRRLLPTVISLTCDMAVTPDMAQQKLETVRYFRGLLMMSDAELEAARGES